MGIRKTWAECSKITQNKAGGHSRKFSSNDDAEAYLLVKIDERDKRKQRDKPKRNRIYGSSPTQGKPTLDHLANFLELKTATSKPEKKHIILTCKHGTGGKASTISHSDGTVYVVQTTPGAKVPLKRLELASAAMKLADGAINANADSVEIIGLDDSVERTLCHLAPDWKERGWLNSAGKPPANLDLIKSMFELYEQIKGKVALGQKQVDKPDTHDAPF
ncbi:hypothetical protein [Photobacterium sanguinicancri]|uniref:Uncharacterized protein n=1 Tax=Photobacterium sanguinicancri TaxID=875932 RepID=A0ABX4FRX7_9GAMM|nr:hypothetical protein [Photobacterium sanguinicancri]OZS41601.1 hypothetical protein ASV53_22845 [Photobacterium sanguinicancri]